MRSDGEVTYYFIQHGADGRRGSWVSSSLDHLLFGDMTAEEKRGGQAARYRELTRPESASSDLWQRYGINGFVDPDDAFAVLTALQERKPDMRFRVAKRHIIQTTTAVVRTLREVPA